MVIKSISCWEEGSMMTLLCSLGIQQSVTVGVLQCSNSFTHGVVDCPLQSKTPQPSQQVESAVTLPVKSVKNQRQRQN